MGDQGPLYCRVDRAVYRSYTPQTCVADLEDWTALLQAHPRCAGAELLLLGVERGDHDRSGCGCRGAVPLAGLLLAGYANGTMEEALDWQQGLGLYTMLCQYFDADGDGSISREEFETGPGAVREALEATFSGLDLDGDGRITPADLEAVYAGGAGRRSSGPSRRGTTSGFGNTTQSPHYQLVPGPPEVPPNRETLPRLDLPIHILQGRWDANTPAEDAPGHPGDLPEAGEGQPRRPHLP